MTAQMAITQKVVSSRRGYVRPIYRRPIVYDLARIAGAGVGSTPVEVLGPGREPWLVQSRWAVMLVLREVRGWSYPHIAFNVGGRDHTTVMYGCRKGAALRLIDAEFAALCAEMAGLAA